MNVVESTIVYEPWPRLARSTDASCLTATIPPPLNVPLFVVPPPPLPPQLFPFPLLPPLLLLTLLPAPLTPSTPSPLPPELTPPLPVPLPVVDAESAFPIFYYEWTLHKLLFLFFR